jgi:hypothetical protein
MPSGAATKKAVTKRSPASSGSKVPSNEGAVTGDVGTKDPCVVEIPPVVTGIAATEEVPALPIVKDTINVAVEGDDSATAVHVNVGGSTNEVLDPPAPGPLGFTPEETKPSPATEEETTLRISPTKTYDLDAAISSGDGGIVATDKPVDTDNGPVSTRVVSKAWLTRRNAYDELKKSIVENCTEELLLLVRDNIKGIIGDSNAGAQSSGVDLVEVWVKVCSKQLLESVYSEVSSCIVEKCLLQRANIVTSSVSIMLEVCRKGGLQAACEVLFKGCRHSKKKIPPECLKILKELCVELGALALPLKELVSTVCESFGSSDNAIRVSASDLMCEVYRWVKTPLRSLIKGLRPKQEEELFSAFDAIDASGETPVPRFVPEGQKSSQPKISGKATIAPNTTAAQAGGSIDPWDFVAEVDLIALLAKSDFEAKLGESKWSERVEALKSIITKAGSPPKLKKEADYSELISTLVAIINRDKIMQVQSHAVQCLGVLAAGLRRSYSSTAKSQCSLMLSLYKNQKGPMIQAVDGTLDLFIKYCFKLSDVSESLNESLESSMPQIQCGTLSWLTRSVTSNAACCPPSFIKPLLVILKKVVSAAIPSVRDAAIECVIAMKATYSSEAPVKAFLEDLKTTHPHIFKKVQATIASDDTGDDVSKAGASDATVAVPSPTVAPPRSSESVRRPKTAISSAAAPAKAPEPSLATAPVKTSALPATAEAVTGSSSMRETRKHIIGDDSGGEMSFEEAEEKLAAANIPSWSDHIKNFTATSKWQDKQAAFDAVSSAIEAAGGSFQPFAEAAIVWTTKQSSDWKASNITLAGSAFKVAFNVLKACTLPRRYSIPVISAAMKKLGDRKFAIVVDLIMTAAELVTPSVIIEESISSLDKVKTPVVFAAVLDLQKQIVTDFGANNCSVPIILKHAKSDKGIESSNPAVKASATNLLGELFHQLGPQIRDVLAKDLKESAMTLLDKHFESVGYDPTILKKVAKKVKGGGPDSDGGSGSLLDELNPRVDITPLLTSSLINDLNATEGKDSWKVRNEALEKVTAILEKNKRVEFTAKLSTFVKSLKLRLADTNGNLRIKALKVIGLLATAVGPKITAFNKVIMANILICCSDNKKQIVTASIECLNSWVSHEGDFSSFQSLLTYLPTAMMTPSGRCEVLEFVLKYISVCEDNSVEPLIAPTVECLQDRATQTRTFAEKILAYIILKSGKLSVDFVTRDLKPAALRGVQSQVEAANQLAKSMKGGTVNNEEKRTGPAADVQAAVAPTTPKRSRTVSSSSSPPPGSSPNAAGTNSGLPVASAIEGSASPIKSTTLRASPPRSKSTPRLQREGASGAVATSAGTTPSNADTAKRARSLTGELSASAGKQPRPTSASSKGSRNDTPSKSTSTPRSTSAPRGSPPRSTSAPRSAIISKSAQSPRTTSNSSISKTPDFEFTTTTAGSGFKMHPSSLKDRENRKKRSLKLKWVFEEPRPEFVSLLKEEMEGTLPSKLISALFGTSPTSLKDSYDGLHKVVQENSAENLLSNLDIIFKWITLQMVGRESAVGTTRQVEFLSLLINALNGHSIDDYDASIFLPFLVEKLGHSKPRFRVAFHDVAISIRTIYQPAKCAAFYMNGIDSKNTRTRTGALEELSRIFVDHGWRVVGKKGLLKIAPQVDHDDKDVRAAAIECMEYVWRQLDEDKARFYDLVSTVSLKGKGILDEHFKYHGSITLPSATGDTPTATGSKRSMSEFGDEEDASSSNYRHPPSPSPYGRSDSHNTPNLPRATAAPPSLPAYTAPTMGSDYSRGSSNRSPGPQDHSLPNVLDSIKALCAYFESVTTPHDVSHNDIRYVEGFESISNIISLDTLESTDEYRKHVASQMDKVIGLITKTLWAAWGKPVFSSSGKLPDPESCYQFSFDLRMTTHLLSAAMVLFEVAALSVSMVALKSFFDFMLVALTDQRLKWVDHTRTINTNSELTSALNYLILRAARYSDRTATLIALIEILIEAETKSIPRATNHTSIVVKLLNKVMNLELSKANDRILGTPFDTVDCSAVMMALHTYFASHKYDVSTVCGDAMKKLLANIVVTKGPSIGINMMCVPSSSPLHRYIKSIAPGIDYPVESGRDSLPPPPINTSPPSNNRPANNSTSDGGSEVAKPLSPSSIQEELSNIFLEVTKDVSGSDPKRKPQGIQNLFAFSKRNPQVDIEKHIAHVSPDFLRYIKRELAKCEASERGETLTSQSNSMTALQSRLANLRARYNMNASSAASSSDGGESAASDYSATSSVSLAHTAALRTQSTSSDLNSLRERMRDITANRGQM